MTASLHDRLNSALLGMALLGLVSGLGLLMAGEPDLATIAWAAGVVPVLAALVVEIIRSLLKGEVGLDVVAALSMSAALLFGEALAAAVVALRGSQTQAHRHALNRASSQRIIALIIRSFAGLK